jgi:cardiolipin synthase A/B
MSSAPTADLLGAARAVAVSGSAAVVSKLAVSMEKRDGYNATARAAAIARITAPALLPVVTALVDAWSLEPSVRGDVLAAVLRSASSTVEHLRSSSSTEIVWTGPPTTEVPVRMSREVLLQVIGASTTLLTLTSFVAYKVPDVLSALKEAIGRGVKVRIVLETIDSGKIGFDPSSAFASLGTGVRIVTWPMNERPAGASMHVKAAIADDHTALVTSANLTGAAQADNMELGILIRGGPVPRSLQDHFSQLIASGVLR